MIGNYSWFNILFKVGNPNELITLLTKYNESLYHLLFGHCGKEEDTEEYDYEYTRVDYIEHTKNSTSRLQIFSLLKGTDSDMGIPIETDCETKMIKSHAIYYDEFDSVNGYTVLMLAVVSSNGPLFQELMKYTKHLNINHQCGDGYTALHLACRSGNLDMVQRLCTIPEINFNLLDKFNHSVLTLAIAKGSDVKIIQELLNHRDRINVNHCSDYGAALLIACEMKQVEILKLLCTVPGINLQVKDHHGRTPLLAAVSLNFVDNVKVLCRQRGLKIDEADRNGYTPRYIAAKNGYHEISIALDQYRVTAKK